MKFQHTTSLAIQPGIVRITTYTASGVSATLIPGQDSTYTITLQQLVFSWTGLTAPGDLVVSSMPSDPNPFVVFQDADAGTVPIPFYDELYNLGTYGLRVASSGTGGFYAVSAFFTQILP